MSEDSPIFDSDDLPEEQQKTIFFPLSLSQVDHEVFPLSLPFTKSIPDPAPNVTGMGTTVCTDGDTWVVLCTDMERVGTDGTATPVVYKLYNKTKADASRDEWTAKSSKTPYFRARK